MPFSHQNLAVAVTQVPHPEQLHDIIILIFIKMRFCLDGNDGEETGFEDASIDELYLALVCTANEMPVRWGSLQNQLGNRVNVVSMQNVGLAFTQYFAGHPVRYPTSGVHQVSH